MTAEEGLAPPAERARRQWPLWFGLLGGPTAWAIHLGFSYLLVPTACATSVIWLHLVTVVSLAIGALALWSAARIWSTARDGADRDQGRDDLRERNRFLGGGGITLSALFLAVILMEGLQPFLIDPCL